MDSALNRFNRIARHYDGLKRFVFRGAIYESQIRFLSSVPLGGNVLILGGGTGEILPLLQQINPECRIWFIDASSQMLKMAFARCMKTSLNRVHFIHGTENDLPEDVVFQAVITNFFLDLFPDDKGTEICSRIFRRVGGEAVWLASDFVAGRNRWQTVFLWAMYRFFRAVCGIEARKLPAWQCQLRGLGMMEMASEVYYRGFMKSVLYKTNPFPRTDLVGF